MEVGFYRHPSKTPNWLTIYVQISMAGQKLEIGSTGIKIPVQDWDDKRKEVAGSNPTCMPYNATLHKIKSRLINIFNELSDKDEPFTVHEVKRIYSQKFNSHQTFHTLLQRFEEYWKERKAIAEKADQEGRKRPTGYAQETIKSIGPIVKKMREYLRQKKALQLRPTEFDQDYYEDYIIWMRSIGLMESTLRAHCNKVKQIFKWMKRKKYINTNHLQGLPLPKDPGTIPQPITTEQYDRLKNHRFKNKNLQKMADLFLIHCRTGFHYKDLQNIIAEARKGLPVTFVDRDGIEWIYKDRQKTEEWAKVPVFDDVKEIVNRYGGWGKLPRVDNSSFNEWLKMIAAELDLPEDLIVSNGRDTMTDWLLNERLVSEETVKVVLGRKDGRDLSRYGKADERRVKKELELIN